MPIYNRENEYVKLLNNRDLTVRELSQNLYVSEATVRRDILLLKKKELVTCNRGLVSLTKNSPDRRIPYFIRDLEQSDAKSEIALKASKLVKDGDTIILDASSTAYHILPHLLNLKNIMIITNGAKTALEAASLGIPTICTGGKLMLDSFCFVANDAEDILKRYNADVCFFSCRGLNDNGAMTDNSILENSIRRIMIKNSKKSYLLCDKSKMGKTYLNTICNADEITGVLTNDA